MPVQIALYNMHRRILLCIGLLSVMCLPDTFGDAQIGEYRFEAGIFRTACVDAETDSAAAFPHVSDAHLRETDAVL